MKFRKKPVVIDAVQFVEPVTPEGAEQLREFLEGCSWLRTSKGLVIKTLEGDMLASSGDWIIKGVNGEYYPCKPEVFAKTYEAENVDKACPCGAPLIRNGVVVKSHWNGSICEDCEGMIFEKHNLGTEDQKMLLLSNRVIDHIVTQYNLRYEELSEPDPFEFEPTAEGAMSIPEKCERSAIAVRRTLRHYFRTGNFVHYSDAEPHLTEAAT
jgi:hypothetical protein